MLDLSRIDTVAFDKTGTLTTADAQAADRAAWPEPRRRCGSSQWLAAESVHPVSRAIAAGIQPFVHDGRATSTSDVDAPAIDAVREDVGRGITGIVAGHAWRSARPRSSPPQSGRRVLGPADVTFVAAGREWGWIRMSPRPRAGIERAARRARRGARARACSPATTTASARAGSGSSAAGCTSGSRRTTSSPSSRARRRGAVTC